MWIVFFKEGGLLLFPITPANSFELVTIMLIDVLAWFSLDLPGYFIPPSQKSRVTTLKKKNFQKDWRCLTMGYQCWPGSLDSRSLLCPVINLSLIPVSTISSCFTFLMASLLPVMGKYLQTAVCRDAYCCPEPVG